MAVVVPLASAQAYGADPRAGFSTIPGRRPAVACAEWGGGLWESQACGRPAVRRQLRNQPARPAACHHQFTGAADCNWVIIARNPSGA